MPTNEADISWSNVTVERLPPAILFSQKPVNRVTVEKPVLACALLVEFCCVVGSAVLALQITRQKHPAIHYAECSDCKDRLHAEFFDHRDAQGVADGLTLSAAGRRSDGAGSCITKAMRDRKHYDQHRLGQAELVAVAGEGDNHWGRGQLV